MSCRFLLLPAMRGTFRQPSGASASCMEAPCSGRPKLLHVGRTIYILIQAVQEEKSSVAPGEFDGPLLRFRPLFLPLPVSLVTPSVRSHPKHPSAQHKHMRALTHNVHNTLRTQHTTYVHAYTICIHLQLFTYTYDTYVNAHACYHFPNYNRYRNRSPSKGPSLVRQV